MAGTALASRLDILYSGRAAADESVIEPEIVHSTTLSFGAAADKAQEVYWEEALTIPASGSVNLSLVDGVITPSTGVPGSINNPKGEVIAYTKIRTFIIVNDHPTIPLTVGNASSNQWRGPLGAGTHTHTIGPGEALVWRRRDTTGFPVSASLTNFKIANTELTAVDVKVLIEGEGTAA